MKQLKHWRELRGLAGCALAHGLPWPYLAFHSMGHCAGNFLAEAIVFFREGRIVQNTGRRFGVPEWLILIGGLLFVLMLAVSAYWESDIRLLHFFQVWMYMAAMVLSFKDNRWGYFIGVSAAGLWDYANIFATTFFLNGLQQLSQWVRTGNLTRPDILIAVPAWFSNFLVIAGCLWAYSRLPVKPQSDVVIFCRLSR